MSDKEDIPAGGNVISLERHRAKKEKAIPDNAGTEEAPDEASPAIPPPAPIPGSITWLRCKSCGTLEYTEVDIAGGRRHKCGAIVEEARVEVDLRAEHTIALINLERIRALEAYLDAQRRHYEEYKRRLEILAGEAPVPYQVTPESMSDLPVADSDALGLLIPTTLHDPAARFEKDGEA